MKYTSKEIALREYKEAKKNYLENMTNENWVKFCDAKTTCMKLGIRIQEGIIMYEVVKTVKGYNITRMIGTKGAYHVTIREGKGFREFHTFRTIKAATEFIEKTL